MNKLHLSLIVIEYYSLDEVICFINAVQTRCATLSYQIIVVSNSDYSKKRGRQIADEFPQAQWLFNGKNLGFARAINVGIRHSNARCLVLSNSDVKILTDLRPAYDYLMQEQEVAVIGPRIVDDDGMVQDSCRDFMTPWQLLTRNWQRIYRHQDSILDPGFDYCQRQQVPWVIGAFMVVKMAAVEKVGLLDSSYFLYVEDMDWCKRFWDSGYRVIYYPELLVEYKGDRKSTSGLRSRLTVNQYTLHHLKSYLRFLSKHRLFMAREIPNGNPKYHPEQQCISKKRNG